MKKQQRRFDFFGNKIKTKKTYEEQTKHVDEEEREPFDYGIIWVVLLAVGLLIAFIVMASLISSIDLSIGEVTGNYTIRIYSPDCGDEIIFEIHEVSAQYLLDNGLGKRISLSGDELGPVVDFRLWDDYVNGMTGSPMGVDGICVEFEKE